MRTADRDNNVNSWAQQSGDSDAERDQQWEAADRENAGSQEDDLLQNELVVGRVPGRCPSCDLSPRLIWNLALSNLIAPFFRSPLLSVSGLERSGRVEFRFQVDYVFHEYVR